ncbi:MAG: hypothetical protein ACKVHL_05265, partial [Rhodospirillales bacterium]
GKEHEYQTLAVRGTPDNQMTREEIDAKVFDLFAGVLGEDKGRKLIDAFWDIENVKNMRDLRPLMIP